MVHVGSRSDKSQCRRCRAELPSGANYCLACGTGVTSTILDPLGVEDASVAMVTNEPRGQRWGLLAVLAIVAGMFVVLWALGRDIDQPERTGRRVNTPEETVSRMARESTELTAAASTITTATTTTTTTTTEQQYVNKTPGPVLGDDVGGVLVQISTKKMHRIDLSTGAIEQIDLEHTVNWDGPESEAVIDGKLVTSGGHWERDVYNLVITDLTDGSQTELSIDREGWMRVLGQADADSAWVGLEGEPDGENVVVELSLGGEVRRRVEVPRPFWINWAVGDDLLLEGMDGSFRYDTDTGTATRLVGSVVAFDSGVAVMASCDESLECEGLIDRGNGPEVVDWLDLSGPDHWWYGSVHLSPDLTGALLYSSGDGWEGFFGCTYVDLSTGMTRNLGEIDVEPWYSPAWVTGTPWIVSHTQTTSNLAAVNTETAEQITLELAPYRMVHESYLAFVPADDGR